MLNELTKNPDRVNEYFGKKAINNSLLNTCFNPKWQEWRTLHPEITEESRVFRIGSAIDVLLTDPERFNSEFFIFNLSKPSGLMGKFIDSLPLFALNEENKAIYGEEGTIIAYERDLSLYKEAYDKAKYKLPIGTVVQNFWTNDTYLAYYRAREHANGKQILSEDESVEIMNALEAIKQNPHAPKFFTSFTQVPIYFSYKNQECKCLLDGIYVDEEKKEIHPFDLKSTGKSTTEFEQSFWMYGYYRQCAFYMEALQQSGIIEYYDKLGYKTMPFKFIVAGKKSDGMPALIYEVSNKTLHKGKYGYLIDGKEYKGFEELFEAYTWHESTRNYSAPKWVIDANYTYVI